MASDSLCKPPAASAVEAPPRWPQAALHPPLLCLKALCRVTASKLQTVNPPSRATAPTASASTRVRSPQPPPAGITTELVRFELAPAATGLRAALRPCRSRPRAAPGCEPAARLCCCSWVTIFYKPLQQKGSHPCHCYTSPRAAGCLCLTSDLNRPHCMASLQWQAAAACLHCEPP